MITFLFFLFVFSAQAQEIRVLLHTIENKQERLKLPKTGSVSIRQVLLPFVRSASSTAAVRAVEELELYWVKDSWEWRGTPYRGRLELNHLQEGQWGLINIVDIEDYLYGVLPSEINTPTWPMEAVKAQAVVSRSYALSQIQGSTSAPFHVSATAQHQMYFGTKYEDERARQAVEETRGEVLVGSDESVLSAHFHSCCGGRTEDAWVVWSQNASRDLVGVSDFGYCSRSPYYSWVTSLPISQLEEALAKLGFEDTPIRSLSPGTLSKSMRAISLRIASGNGRFEVKTVDLRRVLGPNWIRSTKINGIKPHKDRFLIFGKGWGHGVGLCQWGAKGMADKGRDYRRILRHYFPRAKLQKAGGES